MLTIIKNDKIENVMILVISLFIIFSILIYLLIISFTNQQEESLLQCLPDQCKINIYTGIRTCPKEDELNVIDYIPSKELCTYRKKCPSIYPCIDNGSWIDCSNNGNCPDFDENCSCFNFGQCAPNISMAWKFEDELYFNFNNGEVNGKIYGIPIYNITDYFNGTISCRLDRKFLNMISYPFCTSGKFIDDKENGYICCSYNNSCIYTFS